MGRESTVEQEDRRVVVTRAITVILTGIVIALGLSMVNPNHARASAFTPLEWQQEVVKKDSAFYKQRKHQSWNRDQDHDFVDDQIEAHFEKPNQLVNVIVDLNECLPSSTIRDLLSGFGRITYIGKLITFVLLDDVPVKLLPKLAALPTVAMIEWRAPVHPMNRISTRAIQARRSNTYSGESAQDKGLTGAGVTIAILDSGVDNSHNAFASKFKYGYDATTNTVINHPSNPDNLGHGTHVAGIALGLRALTPGDTSDCSIPPDDGSSSDCGGVAPDAKLVDIKVCNGLAGNPCPAVIQGLEWLGLNAQTHDIRVANISLGTKCLDDNGTSTMPQLVNHLVARGIAVSISHGNANPYGDPPNCLVGAQITPSPGSSSFAMTTAVTQDQPNMLQTITRVDDVIYNGTLSGPRTDFDLATNPNRQALKPDFSAPGMNVISATSGSHNGYEFNSGTSMAAPHVAGAAALLIQAKPTIDPNSLKDLLRRTADQYVVLSNGGASSPIDPLWHRNLGSGIINVFQAWSNLAETDVGFANCVGPPTLPGWPCQVTPPQPYWNNTFDIATVDPSSGVPAYPQQNEPILITAKIRNSGDVIATVLVNFGVYEFAVGNNEFFHIGTQQVTVPPMSTVEAEQLWIPRFASHQCIQLNIQYGQDSNFDNNITQRNLEVATSVFEVRIETPFMVPTRLDIQAKSNREGWKCRVSQESFVIDPLKDCPGKLRVAFDAPPGALPGESADCDIAVFGTPKGSEKPILIGGMTVQTFVPKPCRIVGQVVNETNTPVAKAQLVFSRAQRSIEYGEAVAEGPPVSAVTDEDGIFSIRIRPSLDYTIVVEQPTIGKGQVEQRLNCGIVRNKYVLSREGVKLFGK